MAKIASSSFPRHIAFYLPNLCAGGAERVMITLANGLAARGHRVDFVLARAEGGYLSEVEPNVRVVDLDGSRVLFSLLPLMVYLRRERPDAMLSALSHANMIAILARALARTKTRLVVSEHTAPSASMKGNGQKPASHRLIQKLYPHSDKVVCVSRDMQQEMADILRIPQEKLCAIHNPLDIERIHRLMEDPLPHPWFSESKREAVILAVGRLSDPKDYPTLFEAFALLRARRRVKLILVGEGEERDALTSLIERLDIAGDVDMAGFQRNPFAWMKACDVYVMSSKQEGLPGALLEAMACGARVVSTNCPTGPAEILEDGKWGRLVPVGDAAALAEALAAALDDDAPPQGRERVEDFRVDAVVQQYEEVLFP